MTVWVIAMVIFRSPAITMLRQFAPSDQLPKVAILSAAATGADFLDYDGRIGVCDVADFNDSGVTVGTGGVCLGIRRAMAVSLLAIALLCGGLLLSSHLVIELIVLILLGVAFGLLFISQISYALQAVSSAQAGFGTGLYFEWAVERRSQGCCWGEIR